MKTILKILSVLIGSCCFGQTEFLEIVDSADFDNVNFELMKIEKLDNYKVYSSVGDSLILIENNQLNFLDSTITRTTYNDIKKRKPTTTKIPMHDNYIQENIPSSSRADSSVSIYDQYRRLIQKSTTFPYSMGRPKTEKYYGYLDNTQYLSFEIRKTSQLNRYTVSTIIVNYEYGVSPCSNERTLCYFRKKYEINSPDDHCSFLIEENYINDYGLLMKSIIYDKNGTRINTFHFKYE